MYNFYGISKNKFIDDRKTEYFSYGNMKIETETITGWRETNEDSHIVIQLKLPVIQDQASVSLQIFGVFDGHGGRDCSRIVAMYFPKWLIETQSWIEYEKDRLECIQATESDTKQMIKHALIELFQNADKRPEMVNFYGQGTTAIISIITPTACIIANCGDSRAILYDTNCEFLEETYDHKPYQPEEKKRIYENGGYIYNGRIYADLSLSRALGDLDYKKNSIDIFGKKITADIISAIPDIYEFSREQVKKILLICDGYLEELDTSSITKILQNKQFIKKGLTPIQSLTQASIDSYSKDNMTGILIHFDEYDDIFNEKEFNEIPYWNIKK